MVDKKLQSERLRAKNSKKDRSKVEQAGFYMDNYVQSGNNNKYLPLVVIVLMLIFMYISAIVSTNMILQDFGWIDRNSGFEFYSPIEISIVVKYVFHLQDMKKWELLIYYVTPFVVEFLLGVIALRISQNIMKSSKPTGNRHGGAAFASSEDIIKSGLIVEDLENFYNECKKRGVNTGVSFGCALINKKKPWYKGGGYEQKMVYLIEKSENEHILCYAPTRSGKGVGLVIPSLLLWRDSSITLDPKGENWEKTSGWLSSQGHTCIALDLSKPRHRYNPLSELNPESLELSDDVSRIIGVICGEGSKGDNKYWDSQAKELMIAALTYLIVTYHIPSKDHKELIDKMKTTKPQITLFDIAVYLAGIDPRTGKVWETTQALDANNEPIPNVMWSPLYMQFKELAEYQKKYFVHRLSGEKMKAVYIEVGQLIETTGSKFAAMANPNSNNEKTLQLIISTADQNLGVFKLPLIKAITSNSDFKLKDLVDSTKPPTSLFLINPPKDDLTGKTDGVIKIILQNLFISVLYETGLRFKYKDKDKELINKNYNNYPFNKRSVLCMLDEFPKLGKFEIMEKLLADAAGYGAKFYLIAQSDKQINKAYEKDNSIQANCQHTVAYRPTDYDTADALSKKLGNFTYIEETFNVNSNSKTLDIVRERSGSQNWSESSKPLMSADEIMAMNNDDTIIMSLGMKIYGRKLKYFEDPHLNKWSQIKEYYVEEKPIIDDEMDAVNMMKLQNRGLTEQDELEAVKYLFKLELEQEAISKNIKNSKDIQVYVEVEHTKRINDYIADYIKSKELKAQTLYTADNTSQGDDVA